MFHSVFEDQRQHPKIDEVVPMDAGETYGDDHAQPEKSRRECRVLATRTLPVIPAANYNVPVQIADLGRSLGIAVINCREGELTDGRDVAAERKHPSAGGQNLVRG